MSGDDELERLLREVDASLAGAGPASSASASGQVARSGGASAPPQHGRVGRALRTGTVAGVVCGGGVAVVSFLVSWLPFDQAPVNTGFGAFVGAFLTGTVLSLRAKG